MDPQMLQMMMLMGGGDFATQAAGMDMAQKQGLPHINPTNYAAGYEERRAIRQAFQGPGARPMGVRPLHSTGGGMLSQIFGGGMPNDNPDVSALNAQLSPYGLSEGHINPFLFFRDQNDDGSSTWAGNHPKVAKAIEGAMIGAANTGQGNTIGESISNVARSVMSVPQAYRQNQAAQLQAPFDQASMLMKLKDDQADRELKLAQAFHLKATGAAAMDKPTKQFSGALYTSPSTGQVSGYNQMTNSLEPVSGQPESDLVKIGGPQKPTPPLGAAGVYPKGLTTAGQKAAYDDYVQKGWNVQQQGLPMSDPGWNDAVVKHTGRLAGASAGAGEAARRGAAQASGALSDTDKANIADLQKQRDEAFSHYKEKLTPSDVRSRPEGSTTERLQAERAERKAAWDQAESALKRATSGATQGVIPGGARTGGATKNRPKVVIDGTKIVIQ